VETKSSIRTLNLVTIHFFPFFSHGHSFVLNLLSVFSEIGLRPSPIEWNCCCELGRFVMVHIYYQDVLDSSKHVIFSLFLAWKNRISATY